MANEGSYIEGLITNCNAAKQAVLLQTIGPTDNIEDFKGVKNAVYVIEEIGDDADETFKLFRNFKAKKCRSCPKLNNPNKVMYVGSSVGNLQTRLKQHVGDNQNKSTSALNLKHWFEGKYQITAKVYDVSPAVLQIIEDSRHHDLKPAFGKMGGNGR